MNRTKLACFSLIASAAVLAGLLVAQLDSKLELTSTANAQFSTSTPSKTFLTARISEKQFGLFVLDQDSGQVMVYTTDKNRDTIKLEGRFDIAKRMANTFGKAPRKTTKSRR